ncbi:hypothetical protein H112_01249 [Trichophyton rubrum D6]|nr:uncharacterized protein TERG_07662 [Trichophyton rubrum CBS 118892]EZF26734.1 hypothetical protein H100_01242 [Trichophyton rubrum MR850]EZF45710.1 hypothetical protein H102_01238 [Trichophyton rubrum CBS 100081]EZF56413.1 hypothetical protein H103_01245 [Trichophyton rubrum CBS 288.86]EZF66996.1 hypothetical protein H104_01231 [Trichophyton rubrum CBS 289.86]EZF77636.1 hypothetical protein H105_01252 [Trichophyton soudanense CBS 452.61]EZF88343.1 hypothetical protein H110_01249 [Trichophy
MSPSDFITSDHAIGGLKRKLQIDQLDGKRIRLLSSVEEDEKSTECTRQSIPVVVPLSPVLKTISNKMEVLQQQNAELREMNQLLKNQHQATLEMNNTYLEKVTILEKDMESQLHQRANLCIGNMLIEIVRKITQKDTPTSSKTLPTDTHEMSTTRLIQRAAALTNKDLQKSNIPTRYWKTIRNIKKYIIARNSSAHESCGEFAMILKNPSMEAYYLEWSGLFTFTYEETVESVFERCSQPFEVEK